MIGFPDDDRPDLARWIDDITRLRGIDDEKVGEAAIGVMTRVIERLDERAAVNPAGTTSSSVLLDAEIDGRPLDEDEQLFTMVLLLLGGLDTTTSAIAMAMAHLADHPDDRARLLADPDLLDTAVEEFVRVATPVQGLGRTVTHGHDLGGCPLQAGDRVFLLWASGNRDPEAFDRPDEVVLDRHPNHHLGFGAGPHRCVGSHAGKLMVKIALQELLPWLGDYRIADELRLGGRRDPGAPAASGATRNSWLTAIQTTNSVTTFSVARPQDAPSWGEAQCPVRRSARAGDSKSRIGVATVAVGLPLMAFATMAPADSST